MDPPTPHIVVAQFEPTTPISTVANSGQIGTSFLPSVLPKVTPLRYNSNKFPTTGKNAKDQHKLDAEDMENGYTFVETDDFLDDFLPAPSPPPTGELTTVEELLPNLPDIQITPEDLEQKEVHIYPLVAEEMQLSLGDDYFVKITANNPPLGSSTCSKPSPGGPVDLCIFKAPKSTSKSSEPHWKLDQEKARHNQARSAWHEIVVPIEVKNASQQNPFKKLTNEPLKDQCPYPESGTIGGEDNRGQFTGYAGKLFLNQHRISVLSIYMIGEFIYLIRWDRAGAVIARPFSLFKERYKLHVFLSRLTKMSPAQQGYDDSIRPALSAEAKEFLDLKPANPTHQAYLDDARALHRDVKAAIFVVEIDGWDEHPNLRLVFARPRVIGGGVVGRATRGYVAYDLNSKQLVFLKDYWQPASPWYHEELDTYARLKKAKVEHIATPLGGGPVPSSNNPKSPQKTVTQVYQSALRDPSEHPFSERVHYRLVLKEVGRPLEDYEKPSDMVAVVYDAVQAHQQAWELAGVLHRDVSSGNILILDDGEACVGILNDWDMCKYKEELEVATPGGPAFRSGTWMFMSALLLQLPGKPHEVSDDIESFIHVINWLTLRFHLDWERQNYTGFDQTLINYIEHTRNKQGADVGGGGKLNNWKEGIAGFGLDYVAPRALRELVRSLTKLGKEHYSSPKVAGQLAPLYSDPINSGRGKRIRPGPRLKTNNPQFTVGSLYPPTGKPVLDNHVGILGIFESSFDLLWEDDKFKDQLALYQALTVKFGTPRGGSASYRDVPVPQRQISGRGGSSAAGSSKTRSKRRDNTEDLDVQIKSKKAKRSQSEGLPDITKEKERKKLAEEDPFLA